MSPLLKTLKDLENNGYVLKRHGANHDIYYNAEKKITIPVKRHDFSETDRRYVLKEAQIKL